MEVKEDSEKADLNSTFKKRRSWHPVPSLQANRWGKNGNNDRLFLGSKITVNGDCSHQIKKKTLAPWKKSYDKPRWVLKSRDIILPTKVWLF